MDCSIRVIGTEVQSPEGNGIAKIDDLVIDSKDGHIPLFVLYDVKGRGDTLVAVPFAAFSRGSDNGYVLNTTEERLAVAPAFMGFTDMSNRQKAEGIYEYFGLQPYWTEGGGAGSTMEQPFMEQPMYEYYEFY